MPKPPEYLQQPDHIERVKQFINQVDTTAADKYPDLLIDATSEQQQSMEEYDLALKGGYPEVIQAGIDMNGTAKQSDEAEREAVHQMNISVLIFREIMNLTQDRFEQLKKDAVKAKVEIDNLAEKLGGEHDEFRNQLALEFSEDGPRLIALYSYYIFKRK